MVTTVDLSVLDMNNSLEDDSSWMNERNKVLSAFTRNGFIQVINHGVEMKHIDNAFYSARRFFSQPLEHKLSCASKDKARRGYSPMSTENFASLIGESGKPNDTVEKFRIGPTISESERELHFEYYNHKEAKLHFFANEWGHTTNNDCDDGFQSSLIDYYQQMSLLSKRLLHIIERIVGLDRGYFESLTDKHTSILSLNCYPNLNSTENVAQNVDHNICGEHTMSTRVAEHTDVSMLTIVAQNVLNCSDNHTSNHNDNDSTECTGGLEVFDTILNQWLSVPYTDNAFIVNVGDCLSDWSRGLFKSSLHRVRMRSKSVPSSDETQIHCGAENSDLCADFVPSDDDDGKKHQTDRISLAYFLAPNYDAVLDWPVANGCAGGGDGEGSTGVANTNPPDGSADPSVTYTTWRKNRIKRALQSLNKKV